MRLLPDGRPMELIVETTGEDSEQTDMLELIRDQWQELGITIFAKPRDREVLRNRIFSGDSLMTIGYGIDNGMPTAGDAAARLRADQPGGPAAMAEMGPVLRDQGCRRRGAGPARGPALDGAVPGVEQTYEPAGSGRSGTRCSISTPANASRWG